MFAEDRFGNENSSLYLQGHANSYFSLGTSDLVKPKNGAFSLWVKLDRIVYAGKGYESNPIILIRTSDTEDFYDAISLFYDIKSDRLMTFFTKDPTEQAGLNSMEKFEFNTWYHLVVCFTNKHLVFYINGKKQGEAIKNFETVYLKNTPVYVGYGDSKKNDRRMRGAIDDIKIFHRELTLAEIKELYEESNPHKIRAALQVVLRWGAFLLLIFAIASLLVWQRRKALKREKEKFELNNRMREMEIRTLKAQMNPHFIFNSLNSIQQFIVTNENDKAQEYLAKFSKLLRKLLESNVNENLTIHEEVEILNRYLEIEALRFNNSIMYSVSVDEKIDQVKTKIPHLMIQPFVENAIWHGLLPKKDDRKLLVKFEYISNTVVRCIITDNGIGRQLNTHKEDTFKKKSLALSFVKQRLELMSQIFKVNCEVEIVDMKNENGESSGTKIIVDLPIINI